MEELLLAQRCDLIVQEVQQSAVSLGHSSGDGVIVAQGLDTYCEARICLGPCDHLRVVGGEGVSSAVQQGIVSICISIILLQLHIRVVLLEEGLCSGSLGHDQGLALEFVHRTDHSAVRRNHAQGHLHVRKREVHLLCSLRGNRKVSQYDVHLAGCHILHAGSRIQRCEFYVYAEILADSVGIVNIIALVLALVIHITEGSLVGEHTDLHGTGCLDLVKGAEGAVCGSGLPGSLGSGLGVCSLFCGSCGRCISSCCGAGCVG